MMRLGNLLVLILVPFSECWNEDGHSLIAHIAGNFLDASERVFLQQLMGWKEGHNLIQEQMTRVSGWADHRRWSTYYHFVHLRDNFEEFDPLKDCGQFGSNKCLVTGVGNWTNIATDISQPIESRREAIEFLIHVIGDASQPMHVGRWKDRSGNAIENVWKNTYRWSNYKSMYNLHEVWDSGLFFFYDEQREKAEALEAEAAMLTGFAESPKTDEEEDDDDWPDPGWMIIANSLIERLEESDSALYKEYSLMRPTDVSATQPVHDWVTSLVRDTAKVTYPYAYMEKGLKKFVLPNKILSTAYMGNRSQRMLVQYMKGGVWLATALKEIIALCQARTAAAGIVAPEIFKVTKLPARAVDTDSDAAEKTVSIAEGLAAKNPAATVVKLPVDDVKPDRISGPKTTMKVTKSDNVKAIYFTPDSMPPAGPPITVIKLPASEPEEAVSKKKFTKKNKSTVSRSSEEGLTDTSSTLTSDEPPKPPKVDKKPAESLPPVPSDIVLGPGEKLVRVYRRLEDGTKIFLRYEKRRADV